MTISTSYTFDNASNFNFSNTELDSGEGQLTLIPNPGQIFSQSFTSDTGFTYDNTKAEFVGGVLRQKDQSSAASVFAGKMATKDLIWHKSGSVTGTLNGTPTFGTGKMVCTGSQGVAYGYTTTARETYKFLYTPNYTGAPPANVNLIASWNGANNNDKFYMTNSPSGGNNIRAALWDSSGSAVFALTIVGGFSPTASQEYEIEVVLDSVAGTVRVFIDGVLLGTVSPGAWTRGSVSSSIRLGASSVVYNQAEGSFDDLIVFDNAQHTASYTSGYTIPDVLYVGSKVDGPDFTYTGVGTVLSVDNGSTTESGTPRYIVGGMYWNGSAWVASDGTYAQANDFATALANFTSIDLGGSGILPWSVVFTDSNTQSSVDDFSVEVTGQQYNTDGYIEPVQAIEVASIAAYLTSITEPASTSLKVILKIDGVLTYWNGASWVTSDGTISQANTAAEVNTNVSSLSLGANSTVYVRWVLNTSDQQVTPSIDSATITYEFGGVEASTSVCEVYGYLKDITDAPVVGATVSFDLNTSSESEYQEASNRILSTASKAVTTDANGYFSISLIRTSQYSEGGTYTIQITLSNGNIIGGTTATKLSFDVPDSTTKDITDLLPAA